MKKEVGNQMKHQESANIKDRGSVLMTKLQSGDEEAFEEIYQTYKSPVYFFILNMTGRNIELSEELTHEAFLKLYKKRAQFNFSVKFTTWFWTIARNTTIDELRKNNPIDLSISPFDENSEIDSQLLEMESILIKKMQKEQLTEAIESLKVRQKEALLLRISSELEYQEIALIMNLKTNALKALLLRARKNIEKYISHNENAELRKVAP